MGGFSYDRDVGRSSSSKGFSDGGTSSPEAKKALGRRGLHPDLNPSGKIITSFRESPIIIGLDASGSNIEFARIIRDKMPMLHGQIEQQGYLKDFDVCFIAIGDAYCDHAPLQVCDFDYGIALDEQLEKLFLEGGGGCGLAETYELAAHFLNKSCEIPNAKVPFCFIIGDEHPYSSLDSEVSVDVLGEEIEQPIGTKEIFSNLFKKFKGNVFFIQNRYCGREYSEIQTNEVKDKWKKYFGPTNWQKIIPVYEEKSIVDIILGVIATVSRARNVESYIEDMKSKGQTKKRIDNVSRSLKSSCTSIIPHTSEIDLPSVISKDKKSGGRRF